MGRKYIRFNALGKLAGISIDNILLRYSQMDSLSNAVHPDPIIDGEGLSQ